ncbi:MAG TPA: hypothetical protein VF844_02510 [Ktedonobacteraceae bacterium]
MRTTRPTLGKYICGMAASLILFLAGGWLILAPFALAYQPYGTDWVSQTTNSFVVGICVAVVALLAFALFFASLLGSLRATGVITAPTRVVAQAITPYQAPAPVSQAPAQSQSDLDKTLATLAAALAADLSARRQAGSDQQSDQTQSIVDRRES